jgi:hypothetical protein
MLEKFKLTIAAELDPFECPLSFVVLGSTYDDMTYDDVSRALRQAWEGGLQSESR